MKNFHLPPRRLSAVLLSRPITQQQQRLGWGSHVVAEVEGKCVIYVTQLKLKYCAHRKLTRRITLCQVAENGCYIFYN